MTYISMQTAPQQGLSGPSPALQGLQASLNPAAARLNCAKSPSITPDLLTSSHCYVRISCWQVLSLEVILRAAVEWHDRPMVWTTLQSMAPVPDLRYT